MPAGFDQSKFITIHNGYDQNRFKYNHEIKEYLRDKYNIKKEDLVFGFFGRFSEVKNLNLFLKAINHLKLNQNFKYVFCGHGLNKKNTLFYKYLDKEFIDNNLILFDYRNDIENIFNMIDCLVLTSFAESFPNVVCEAMLTKVPCISTNVGDIKKIKGDDEFILNSYSEIELAKKMILFSKIPKSKLEKIKINSRERIKKQFSITKMTKAYDNLYKKMVQN